MKKIYIASPYTVGDVAINVRRQLEAAGLLIGLGHAPFAPLLSHFQHMFSPQPYEKWIEIDLVWLRSCDAVLRLPGVSKGADIEVMEAIRLGLPVFNSVREIELHIER